MTKTQFDIDRKIYMDYMDMKMRNGDMHGASDAANDVRELEAEWRGYQKGQASIPVRTACADGRHVWSGPFCMLCPAHMQPEERNKS